MTNNKCSCLGGAESPIKLKLVENFNKRLLEAESSNDFTVIAGELSTEGDHVWAEKVCNRAIELATDFNEFWEIGHKISQNDGFNNKKRIVDSYYQKVSESDLTLNHLILIARIIISDLKEVQSGKELCNRAISSAHTSHDFRLIAIIAKQNLRDNQLTKELLLKAISLANGFDETVSVARDARELLKDSILTRELLLKAISLANGFVQTESIAHQVMNLLKDSSLTRELLFRALSLAENSKEIILIASDMQELLQDTIAARELLSKSLSLARNSGDIVDSACFAHEILDDTLLARELFEKAEEKAINSSDFEYIGEKLKIPLGDKKWSTKLLNQAKKLSNDPNIKKPLKKSAKLLKTPEKIIVELNGKLEKIITENNGNFREEKNFKVRPGYGPDKFYLDRVEGSYEDSLQLLIHYILYEDGLYKKFLTKKQIASCEEVINEYPESIYGSEDGSLQQLLDDIYSDSIKFVGNKLLSLGFDVEDEFKDYL